MPSTKPSAGFSGPADRRGHRYTTTREQGRHASTSRTRSASPGAETRRLAEGLADPAGHRYANAPLYALDRASAHHDRSLTWLDGGRLAGTRRSDWRGSHCWPSSASGRTPPSSQAPCPAWRRSTDRGMARRTRLSPSPARGTPACSASTAASGTAGNLTTDAHLAASCTRSTAPTSCPTIATSRASRASSIACPDARGPRPHEPIARGGAPRWACQQNDTSATLRPRVSHWIYPRPRRGTVQPRQPVARAPRSRRQWSSLERGVQVGEAGKSSARGLARRLEPRA